MQSDIRFDMVLEKLMKAHEALLNTLGASQHPWIKKVHKNAAAYYETWKKELNGLQER